MTPVTDSAKRYITCCAVCGGLFRTPRTDAMTCSPQCRTRGHRTGDIKKYAKWVHQMAGADVGLPLFLRTRAVHILLPERAAQIIAGTLQPDSPELLAEMDAAFRELERACMQLAIERAQGANRAAGVQP